MSSPAPLTLCHRPEPETTAWPGNGAATLTLVTCAITARGRHSSIQHFGEPCDEITLADAGACRHTGGHERFPRTRKQPPVSPKAQQAPTDDPYLWLEKIHGKRRMAMGARAERGHRETLRRQPAIRTRPATAFSRCSTPMRASRTSTAWATTCTTSGSDKDAPARHLAAHHAGRIPQGRPEVGDAAGHRRTGQGGGPAMGVQGCAVPEAGVPSAA